jgi:riboflavin kinase/FMN adenylyltransferase
MQVHQDINNLPFFKNAVITIGTFDGVHCGHHQIIKLLKDEAKNIAGESVIITFHPHPRMIVESTKGEIKLLNTLQEKIVLLERNNIGHVVVVPFTKQFSEQSAESYIKDFLVKTFKPKTIIIGYDHHFGKDRKGNYRLLEAYQKEYNYTVKEIPQHVLNQVTISSTKIREALLKGNIEIANSFLGYEYFFEGVVVKGNKIGRTIGYPTANLEINDVNKLIPGNGIYAVKVLRVKDEKGKLYNGMMSIGVRPTIGVSERTIEINIFNFDDDIYGEKIRVFLKNYLREEKKFNGLEELKQQIDQDKLDSLKLLSEP